MTLTSPDDLIECVKRHPDYGYAGKVDEIRRVEYSHLGGNLPRLQFPG